MGLELGLGSYLRQGEASPLVVRCGSGCGDGRAYVEAKGELSSLA